MCGRYAAGHIPLCPLTWLSLTDGDSIHSAGGYRTCISTSCTCIRVSVISPRFVMIRDNTRPDIAFIGYQAAQNPGNKTSTLTPGERRSQARGLIHPLKISVNRDTNIVYNTSLVSQITGILTTFQNKEKGTKNMSILSLDSPEKGVKN